MAHYETWHAWWCPRGESFDVICDLGHLNLYHTYTMYNHMAQYGREAPSIAGLHSLATTIVLASRKWRDRASFDKLELNHNAMPSASMHSYCRRGHPPKQTIIASQTASNHPHTLTAQANWKMVTNSAINNAHALEPAPARLNSSMLN